MLSGSNLPVGFGLGACTSDVQAANPFILDDKVITLIDTPGFDHTHKSEAEILALLSDFLVRRSVMNDGVISAYEQLTDLRVATRTGGSSLASCICTGSQTFGWEEPRKVTCTSSNNSAARNRW